MMAHLISFSCSVAYVNHNNNSFEMIPTYFIPTYLIYCLSCVEQKAWY